MAHKDGPKAKLTLRPNEVEWDKRADGKWQWRIVARGVNNLPDNIIATDGSQGYENESDCLAGLFRVFFGSYGLSFLSAHARWSEFSGEDVPESFVRDAEAEKAMLAEVMAPEESVDVPAAEDDGLFSDGRG